MAIRWPMWLGLALALAALAAGFALEESRLEQWSAATRFTARVGFPLLIAAYVARPLVELTRADWAKAILARRKWIGLGFAMSHSVHLFTIVMLFRTMGESPATITLIFGGIAYVLLYAMAFTSNPGAMKAMGKWWKRLHRIGIHYLWFIFAQSYFGRIFREETMEEGLLFTTIAVAAALVRFTIWRRGKLRRRALGARSA